MIELYQTAQTTPHPHVKSFAPTFSNLDSESRLGWRYLRRQTLSSMPLLLADLLSIGMITLVALLVSQTSLVAFSMLPVALGLYLTAASLLSLLILGMYPNLGLHPAVELKRIIVPCSIIAICLVVTLDVGAALFPQFLGIGLIWILMAVAIPMNRSLFRKLSSRYCKWSLQPLVILGGGRVGEAIYRSITVDPKCGFIPVGIIDNVQDQLPAEQGQRHWYIGGYSELGKIVEENDIYWAVVTDCLAFDEAFNQTENEVRIDPVELPHRLYLAETASFVPTMWDQVLTINLVAYFKQTDRLLLPVPRLVKRAMDYLVCLLFALLLFPLMAILSLLIKLTSRGPVFFQSKRIGCGNRIFRMFKFRSMYMHSEQILKRELGDSPRARDEWKVNRKLKRDPRITPVGQLLRRTSLDELPQIFDVLRGEMSLVGPRPMLVSEPDMYGDHYSQYCRMRPGITGLWQVSGRNNTSHEQRVRLVAYYVQNWSPWLDIYILAKTLRVVTTGEGAY